MVAFVPGCAISITVIGFNLFGDALRDILDPRHYTGPGLIKCLQLSQSKNLKISFSTSASTIEAVSNISFVVKNGEARYSW